MHGANMKTYACSTAEECLSEPR